MNILASYTHNKTYESYIPEASKERQAPPGDIIPRRWNWIVVCGLRHRFVPPTIAVSH